MVPSVGRHYLPDRQAENGESEEKKEKKKEPIF
jgi:hypothetical protein